MDWGYFWTVVAQTFIVAILVFVLSAVAVGVMAAYKGKR
jgi:ABC-type Fe3+ transport system permease subunit